MTKAEASTVELLDEPAIADMEALRAASKEALQDEGPYVTLHEVFDPLKAKYQAMVKAERER